ncbi:MAG TPA: hypothetical protein VFJ93_07510 [Gaiellaceae bacterium]|nr:hypothetical protein [Gaiellaceae bacterium]
MRIGVLSWFVVALVAAPAAATEGRQPSPLRGSTLGSRTGLRLVVAGKPPFVVDVDSGRVAPLRGVRSPRRGSVSVLGVGGRSAVVLVDARYRHADLYGIRGNGPRVASLGTGSDAAPGADGRSVLVKSFLSDRCTLRQVTLDGRPIRTAYAFPCASTIQGAGSAGLVVNRTRLIDPRSGRTLLRTRWGVLAAGGRKLVLAGPNDTFVVQDTTTGARRSLPWPQTIGRLDRPAADPRGRFVALAFANPAWKLGSRQVLDVWLLDLETMRLTHVPGMPVFVSLKSTSMTWTDDGRLVLLAKRTDRRDAVAVWRPGRRRLAVKTLHLPPGRVDESGSDSFAVVR